MASEKDPLLATSSPPINTSSSMLHQPFGEASASRSLFMNDVEGAGGDEASATQKWEIVIAYNNPAVLDFISPEEKHKQEKRDDLVNRLREVGLFVSQRESSDSKLIFLLLGASQTKLEEYAELVGLELNLKDEYGGGFSAFTIEKKHLFKLQGKDGLFNKTERQRLMIHVIEADKDEGGAELDLRAMEYDGVVGKVYPLHENTKRRELIDGWVKSKNPIAPIPMDQIRHYFGEEISFYFAWLAFYTKWLGFASTFGIATAIIGFIGIKAENYWSNTIYSIFIGIWITLFLEFWKRERNVRAWQWNMLDFENEEGLRPGFVGEDTVGAYAKGVFIPLRKDEVYGISEPKPIKSFPETTTRSRMFVGFSLILTLCVVVGISSFAVLTFRILVQNRGYSLYASVVGGISNAVVIMIMNKVYRFVAVKLNDWENHRTQTHYTDNLLFKIFLFQFVNSYTSMYYIAFFKRSAHLWGDKVLADTCGDDSIPNENTIGCANQLYIQLLTILGTNIAVGQAQEVLIPFILAKVKMMWLQKSSSRKEEDIPKYEREYQLNQFEGTVDEYGEMVIQFGYLTLFASSIPLAPLLAVLNNIVEMRTDAFKWLTSYNKPFYRGADDIGGWYTILQVLGVIAVITNCLLIMFSFPTLYDVFHDNKYRILWTVVILEHLILLVKYVLQTLVPDVPKKIQLVLAKQFYIQQQLIKKFERKNAGKRRASVARERSVYMKKEMEDVEKYDETHV